MITLICVCSGESLINFIIGFLLRKIYFVNYGRVRWTKLGRNCMRHFSSVATWKLRLQINYCRLPLYSTPLHQRIENTTIPESEQVNCSCGMLSIWLMADWRNKHWLNAYFYCYCSKMYMHLNHRCFMPFLFTVLATKLSRIDFMLFGLVFVSFWHRVSFFG